MNICVIKKVSDVMWNKEEEEVCGKADKVDEHHIMLNQKLASLKRSRDEDLYLVLSSLGSKIWAPKMWAGSARTKVSCVEPSHGGPLICDFLKMTRKLVENHQAHVLEWN